MIEIDLELMVLCMALVHMVFGLSPMAVPVLLRKERDRDRDRQRARDRAWDRSTVEFLRFSALVSYKLTGFVVSHQISGFITCIRVRLPGTWRCCSRATTQNS